MSQMNPFTPKENEHKGESNVFLDLNKPDEATGVPAITPGLGADKGGSGFMAAGSESSKFNGQVILAGLVFVIGVGAIYAMRYIGMQAGIKESVTMVEYTASTTTPDFVQRFDEIMDDLEEVSVSVRFDADTKLPTSPFTMAGTESEPAPVINPNDTPEDANAKLARLERIRAEQERAQRESRVAELDQMARSLNLQSVLGGTRPVARISGEPVRVGMLVAKTFKVISIDGSKVIVEAEGVRYQIGLGTGAERID